MVSNGLLTDPSCVGKIISLCALSQLGVLDYSVKILNQSQNPTTFTFNTVIRAFSKSPTPEQSFSFYHQILQSQHHPDNHTFNFLVRSCVDSVTNLGPGINGAIVQTGFESDLHIQSGLIHMYADLGCLDSAHQLFDKIPKLDLVTQTAMVGAYAKMGEVEYARKLFDKMPQRDLVAWNSMIFGYSQSGWLKEALELFGLLQCDRMRINEATLVTVFSACAQLGALDQGKWIPAFIERNDVKLSVTLEIALIDMDSKCGHVTSAMKVFPAVTDKNVYTWSSMMGGLAMNGAGEESLALFTLMLESGILPNDVTFVYVLHACNVVGLIEKGCELVSTSSP